MSDTSPRPWRISDSHGLCIVDDDGCMVLDGDPASSMLEKQQLADAFNVDLKQEHWTAKRADLQLACDAVNGMLSLGILLTLHKATALAKEHCGHKGLNYVDAQMQLEYRIVHALSVGEEKYLRYTDQRLYLDKLRKEGVVR